MQLLLTNFFKFMSKEIIWSVTRKNVADLTKNNYNPRKMSQKEKSDLKESIKAFGAVVPVVLNTGSRENVIIGGEQRVRTYADLGITTIDCVVPSRELSETEEVELNLRLNKNVGSWHDTLLKEINIDVLLQVGFGDEELQTLFDDVDVVDDDFDHKKAIKETTIAKVKQGEIWQLGRHKLLVGDSTNKDQVEMLMGNDKADLVMCDSPYNLGISYSRGISKTKSYGGSFSSKDDSKSDADFMDFLDKSISIAKSVSKPDVHFFYWCSSEYIWIIQQLFIKHDIRNRRVAIWLKNLSNPTKQVAMNKVYEACPYGTIGKPYLNQDMNSVTEILNQEVSTGNRVHDEVLDMIDVWLEKREPVTSYLHPTQKPVSLYERPFKRCSAPLHIIYSGFGGSGSDLIACETLNRIWRGVEIDPIFATIIIDRWEKFTNNKAVRIYENI
jgi:DNA modification methylase